MALVALVQVRFARGEYTDALAAIDELSAAVAIADPEGIATQVAAWRALTAFELGDPARARALLTARGRPHGQWPHVQVRDDLWIGRAWSRLGDEDEAIAAFQRALATAEATGYRWYQLLAHHELASAVGDEATRARHTRVASALSRSIAANLDRDDARRFTDVGWGYGPG